MYEEFLNHIKEKYNYSDSIIHAIRICIPALVDEYGKDSEDKVLKLFEDVRIITTNDMSTKHQKEIENEFMKDYNHHVVMIENNPYEDTIDPEAYYSFRPIFDDSLNVVNEMRWIVVDENKNNNGVGYQKLFGTPINIPNFLHELNHAYAMQNAVYVKTGNRIYNKHGMYINEMVFEYDEETKQYVQTEDINYDILLEEAINEMYTERQLATLLHKESYDEVRKELNTINHVTNAYEGMLIIIAESFEKTLNSESLKEYRINNEMSVRDIFNSVCSESKITEKYIKENAWDYLGKKCFEMFKLAEIKYKIGIDEYSKRQLKLALDAFAPIYAHDEIKHGTASLEKYEGKIRQLLGDDAVVEDPQR